LPVNALFAGEKIRIGGLELKILKKENGLKFGVPFSSMVLTNATGRGTIADVKKLDISFKPVSFGMIVFIGIFFSITENTKFSLRTRSFYFYKIIYFLLFFFEHAVILFFIQVKFLTDIVFYSALSFY
jgi:hypothetical protein